MSSTWTREGSPPLVLRSSPSLLLNNLSSFSSHLCYARKDEVVVVTDNKSPRRGAGQKAPIQTHTVQQAKYCTINNNNYLVVASTAGVQLYNVEGNKVLNFFPISAVAEETPEKLTYTRGIAACPSTGHLLVGTCLGTVLALSITADTALELRQELVTHKAAITTCAANASLAASGDDAGVVVVWDTTEEYRRVATFTGPGVVTCLLFPSPDVLVATYSTGHMRYFRIADETPRLHAEVMAHSRTISALDVHPNQPLVASVGEDSMLCVWSVPDFDTKGGAEVRLVFAQRVTDQILVGVQFCRDRSDRIATTAYDNETIQMWTKVV